MLLSKTLKIRLGIFICRNIDCACSELKSVSIIIIIIFIIIIIPPATKLGGVYWIQPVCLSVCLSVRLSVCLSVNLSCPPCSIYSSWWILSIFGTNDHYHEKVCRMWWPLTLTYIFKVIQPWLRKSCPLCSVYSSRWIPFIFGTNNHYH